MEEGEIKRQREKKGVGNGRGGEAGRRGKGKGGEKKGEDEGGIMPNTKLEDGSHLNTEH